MYKVGGKYEKEGKQTAAPLGRTRAMDPAFRCRIAFA
jgi:hypothetical protein